MAIPQTPTRRSKRFVPLATPSKQRRENLKCKWTGEPIYVRPTNMEHDVSQDEREEYDRDEEYETHFFESFRMAPYPPAKARRTGTHKVATTTEQVYRIGDTVLIETNTLDTMKKPPSIAVIVSMWDVRKTHVETDGSNRDEMRIRVHWFLRPSELARVRASREHSQVR
jgi:origin recognition complex subunit 1